jgi:hypothetical protein
MTRAATAILLATLLASAGCDWRTVQSQRIESADGPATLRVQRVRFVENGTREWRLFLPDRFDWRAEEVQLIGTDGRRLTLTPSYRRADIDEDGRREVMERAVSTTLGDGEGEVIQNFDRRGPIVRDRILWPSGGGLFIPDEVGRSKLYPHSIRPAPPPPADE